MRCLERQGKATQDNRKTKQHNTTRQRQLFFKKKLAADCPLSSSGMLSVQITQDSHFDCHLSVASSAAVAPLKPWKPQRMAIQYSILLLLLVLKTNGTKRNETEYVLKQNETEQHDCRKRQQTEH